MLPIDTEYGVLTLRIINDWTFSASFNFTKFFYYSLIAHLLIIGTLAFPMLLKADDNTQEENKKTEERVTALLEKIEEKEPKKEKVKEESKKEVKQIVVQKKEKKEGFWPDKNIKKNVNKKRVTKRTVSRKNTKVSNGGGGNVTNKNVSKSLDFLNSGSSNKVAINTTSTSKTTGSSRGFGSNGIAVKGISSDNSTLKGGSNYSGAIETKGVRGVKSAKYKGNGDGSGSGYTKSLNNIEGKVSVSTLGKSNKGSIGGSLSRSGGLRLTGKGKISQNQIQKAINKKLYRLTYCYEKSLLSNPNLSGVIKIQWTITSTRRVKNTKIVSSQMKDSKLHNCLMTEIKKIKFPAPKGGDATVIYPFKFKPTL
jgi:biopolymer transport protein ExbD